jgi:hypothetical protein
MLEEGNIDGIAIDLKYHFLDKEKYFEIIGKEIDIEEIWSTINYVQNYFLDITFRTTVLPEFTIEDIEKIVEPIYRYDRYILQQSEGISREKLIKFAKYIAELKDDIYIFTKEKGYEKVE